MSIYLLKANPSIYHALTLVDPNQWEISGKFIGIPLTDSWKPIAVNEYLAEKPGDLLYLAGHMPVFSEPAWRTLAPLIKDSVEALPLQSERHRYYVINVLTVLDCLDTQASVINRAETGHIYSIKKFVFKPGSCDAYDIFKLREAELLYVFVSDRFQQAVAQAGLDGFGFVPVG